MKTKVVLGIVLMAFWLLLSGHYTPLLTSLGVLSCLLVVNLKQQLQTLDQALFSGFLLRQFWFFWPWLIKEIVLANIDVAKRILLPHRYPITPRLLNLEAPQRTELGRVLYANSITLTPGTVSVFLDDQRVEVHALTADSAQALEQGEMARRLCAIERVNR